MLFRLVFSLSTVLLLLDVSIETSRWEEGEVIIILKFLLEFRGVVEGLDSSCADCGLSVSSVLVERLHMSDSVTLTS